MTTIDRLIKKYIAHEITLGQFLHRLEREKESNWNAIKTWWKSPEAYETVWNELGGFDEREFDRRVNDAFYVPYSGLIRKALEPVLKRKIGQIPEIGMVVKKVEPFLFSDMLERVKHAETVEEIYYALDDDLRHWLVVYLVDYLKVPTKATPKRVDSTR